MLRSLVCKECGEQFEAKRSDAFRCPECRKNRRVDLWRFEQRHSHPCADCWVLCGRRAVRCIGCENIRKNGLNAMEQSPVWKGGRHVRKRDGYVEIRVGSRISRLEHRVVWEQANGPIPQGWVVHHLNGIKTDNRLANLVAMPRWHHGPRVHIDPTAYEERIRELEAQLMTDPQHTGLVSCTGCGEPVWPEHNPCDPCRAKAKRDKTEKSEPEPHKKEK